MVRGAFQHKLDLQAQDATGAPDEAGGSSNASGTGTGGDTNTAAFDPDAWPNDKASVKRERASATKSDLLGARAFHRWLRARPQYLKLFFSRFELLPSPAQECARVRQALEVAAARGLRLADRWFVVNQRWWDGWKSFVGFDAAPDDELDDRGGGGDGPQRGGEEGGSSSANDGLPAPPGAIASSASSSSVGAASPSSASLRPIAIDNGALRGDLFDVELRPGLVEGRDYTLLPASVWSLLHGTLLCAWLLISFQFCFMWDLFMVWVIFNLFLSRIFSMFALSQHGMAAAPSFRATWSPLARGDCCASNTTPCFCSADCTAHPPRCSRRRRPRTPLAVARRSPSLNRQTRRTTRSTTVSRPCQCRRSARSSNCSILPVCITCVASWMAFSTTHTNRAQ
jgi:hypothetical protein